MICIHMYMNLHPFFRAQLDTSTLAGLLRKIHRCTGAQGRGDDVKDRLSKHLERISLWIAVARHLSSSLEDAES